MAQLSQQHLGLTAAKHDGIQLDCFTIWLSGFDHDVTAFLITLSTASLPLGEPSLDDAAANTLFCTLQTTLRYHTLKTRERVVSGRHIVGSPLFSAKLELAQRRAQRDHHQLYQGAFKVILNPIRAFVHNRPRGRRITVADTEISLQARELPANPTERSINPLDDNVAVHPTHQRALHNTDFDAFTRTYVSSTIALLRNALTNARRVCALDGSSVQLHITDDINVLQVETAWDIPDTTPIDTVYAIEPRFRAHGRDSRRRIYRNVYADQEILGNVPVISTRAGRGRIAKLYPKSNRKLRLEITHDMRADVGLGRHRFTGSVAEIQLFDLLDRCKRQASEDSTLLAQDLRSSGQSVERPYSPYMLMREIMMAEPDEAAQALLLSILINNGRYRHRTQDPLQRAVRRLRSRGVLRSSRRNSRVYVVAPEYQEARRILANHGSIEVTE